MIKTVRTKPRKMMIPILIVVLLVVAGAGYYFWSRQNGAPAQAAGAASEALNTTQVKRGSITISATGSGTLAASQESSLSFTSDGTVAVLNVKVGDKVKKGDVLAALADQDGLNANVNSAQQDLTSAQQALDTLKSNAQANIANAELKVVTDTKTLDDAKSALIPAGAQRCDQDTTEAYYNTYLRVQKQLDDLGDGGGNSDYYLTYIVPAKNEVAKAYAAYKYCAGYNDYEITESQANLSLAEATLKTDQEALDTLKKNNGIDPTDLAEAQNKVVSAQLALEQAKTNLAGATLTAPFDGTILSINGKQGDTVNEGEFMTIADLAHPLIDFSVDETDMDKVSIGEDATITFEAIDGKEFKGTVTAINPSLQTSNGYQVLQGTITMDLSNESTENLTLIKGMNATVKLIKASAENALIVPIAAVRDLGDGTFGVFVMENGQPRLKVVEVGLQDVTNAEIKSGLKMGDVVTTGVTETK